MREEDIGTEEEPQEIGTGITYPIGSRGKPNQSREHSAMFLQCVLPLVWWR